MRSLANQFGRVSRRWILTLAIFAIATAAVTLLERPRIYDGTKIAAAPFAWPSGCTARSYRVGDQLPNACFDRFQKLSHQWIKEHGLRLKNGRGKTVYHRIGNDAAESLCVIWEDSCTIRVIYRDVFVPDGRIRDTSSWAWRTIPRGENS
jgi:hypothetical protein